MSPGSAGQIARGGGPTATDLTLRRMIGLLGTLLPFVLLFGGYLSPHSVPMRTSISAYYYTDVGYLFVTILLATGAFLICYRGHSTNQPVNRKCWLCVYIHKCCPWIRDDGLTSLAGALAILVAVLPATDPKQGHPDPVNYVHSVLAVAFLLTMAMMSYCQFTLGQGAANALYRTCGRIIVVAIGVILGDYLLGRPLVHIVPTIVWWFEAVAVAAFGFSWLVKSELICTRRKQVVVGLILLVLFLLAVLLVPDAVSYSSSLTEPSLELTD